MNKSGIEGWKKQGGGGECCRRGGVAVFHAGWGRGGVAVFHAGWRHKNTTREAGQLTLCICKHNKYPADDRVSF